MPVNKRTRAYGLFERVDGKYVRILPNLFGSKDYMVRVCQDALLAYFFGTSPNPRELRPIGNLQTIADEWYAKIARDAAAEIAKQPSA